MIVDPELLSAYYAEFRRMARNALSAADRRLTIQPTELAHEAAARLLHSHGVNIRDEAHFLALSARTIRLTLIDEIRRRRAGKRGLAVVTVWREAHEAAVAQEPEAPLDVEAFDSLLDRLAEVDAEAARVVEMRFYVGMTMEEIARALSVSESTTLRRWRTARAWLFKELQAAA